MSPRPLRIVHLTAGTGSFFCGTCLRDNALVRGLQTIGHTAVLQPLYLPIVSEGTDTSAGQSLYLGGVNVYLQHAVPLFRHTPRWIDAAFDSASVLALAARQAGSTAAADTAALTVQMLCGTRGTAAKEIRRLVTGLQRDLATHAQLEGPPDAFVLSNSLLAGLAQPLLDAFGVPVWVTLQGEVHYVRAMGETWTPKVLAALAEAVADASGVIAVSHTAADLARDAGILGTHTAHVVHNGVQTGSFQRATPPTVPGPVRLAHLSRFTANKGADLALQTTAALRAQGLDASITLFGTVQGGEQPVLRGLHAQAEALGLAAHATLEADVTPERKRALLAQSHLLLATSHKRETGGLYVLEAMAAGVPVLAVQRGAFTELLTPTAEGHPTGLLQPLDDSSPDALAATAAALLTDPARWQMVADAGHQRATQRHDEAAMAHRVAQVLRASMAPADARGAA